ncbi:uncharacterized protein FOMMEDRAFT_153938 [Fomitiporia mediterranea MF3/22]|uniref:uncharacterized protein n=1 Tax=Fomitiporia mediterranea (strain MF3/22) TaxID=694068 RepID=UPI0004408697|nr:uncharacterized protein FOMMEDRAFT_153938 [Fomitiporia mediterranea MF3/22]EJD04814.1 hypothetical protein FOMMEDRAFT_153938 [Fomitiporia mediterranea MF3/22]
MPDVRFLLSLEVGRMYGRRQHEVNLNVYLKYTHFPKITNGDLLPRAKYRPGSFVPEEATEAVNNYPLSLYPSPALVAFHALCLDVVLNSLNLNLYPAHTNPALYVARNTRVPLGGGPLIPPGPGAILPPCLRHQPQLAWAGYETTATERRHTQHRVIPPEPSLADCGFENINIGADTEACKVLVEDFASPQGFDEWLDTL